MARMPTSKNQSASSPWRALWLLLTGALVLQVQPLMGAYFTLADGSLKAKVFGPNKVKQGVSAKGGANVTYLGRCNSDGSCTKAHLEGWVEIRGPKKYFVRGPKDKKTLRSGESEDFVRKWRFPAPGEYTVTVQIYGTDDDGIRLKYVKSRKVIVTP